MAPSNAEDSAADNTIDSDGRQTLRKGWTTGSCATAASRAAYEALVTGTFPDPVTITLPDSKRAPGQDIAFALCYEGMTTGSATAGVIKDAGDDPDITHGATIISTVTWGTPAQGIRFHAGEGVGTVTKPGLPIDVGEPAINPVPRQMITTALTAASTRHKSPMDVDVTLSIPGGKEMALKTWNPQLGIVGGLSVLGTTGVVVPYSCSAWIHSIHRGVDVARATGLKTILASTGATSQRVAQHHFGIGEDGLIDMGDFAGGLLKYLRQNPVPHLILAGGIGKLTKLACGAMDLHSGRSTVDTNWLADLMVEEGIDPNLIAEARQAASAAHVLSMIPDHAHRIGQRVALAARQTCRHSLGASPIHVTVLVTARDGTLLGETDAHTPL